MNVYIQDENSVYESAITCNEQNYSKHIYIGGAETTFKRRYSNHKRSFILAA